jgi:glycerol-3-phosphate dehydrogenase
VVSILGGKLTDCLNVGQEICDELSALGHRLKPAKTWFGEGSQQRKAEFFGLVRHLAEESEAAERIAAGIWRRQGERGFDILSTLGDRKITEIVSGLGISEVELRYIAANEQVKSSEDLLRRRLPVAMSRSASELEANVELNRVLSDLGLR